LFVRNAETSFFDKPSHIRKQKVGAHGIRSELGVLPQRNTQLNISHQKIDRNSININLAPLIKECGKNRINITKKEHIYQNCEQSGDEQRRQMVSQHNSDQQLPQTETWDVKAQSSCNKKDDVAPVYIVPKQEVRDF